MIVGKATRYFHIARGLRHGDALSCTLFNNTIEMRVRGLEGNPNRPLLTRMNQQTAYTVDVDLISPRLEELRIISYALRKSHRRLYGITITEKAKYIRSGRNENKTS